MPRGTKKLTDTQIRSNFNSIDSIFLGNSRDINDLKTRVDLLDVSFKSLIETPFSFKAKEVPGKGLKICGICCGGHDSVDCLHYVKPEVLKQESDNVNHPSHYGGDTPYETIKVIEYWKLNFNLGNTVKYISRADHKGNRLEDLKNAQFYLNREISNIEKK